MQRVPQTIERLRAALFGPRRPGRHAARALTAAPAPARAGDSRIEAARVGRASRIERATIPDDDPGVFVRPYVLPEQRARLVAGVGAGR